MTNKKLSIAIVGAGMGGLAVAATLRQAGFDVQVYEQASRFGRIGAGIQMMPNSMKVLRRIGIEDRLRAVAFAPYSHLNRDGYSGEMTRELPMPESLYGAPYLCMHRAELHDALASAVPADIIHLGKKLVGLDQKGGQVTLSFADGTTTTAGAVVGADGVHSIVRDIIVGPDAPIHRGRIAYRAVFPAHLMGGFDIGRSRTKWWGSDRHIVIYYTTKAKSEVYFVTSVPEEAGWVTKESWSAKGDVRELRAAYDGFHQDVRNVLEACPDCHKWAILEREPLRQDLLTLPLLPAAIPAAAPLFVSMDSDYIASLLMGSSAPALSFAALDAGFLDTLRGGGGGGLFGVPAEAGCGGGSPEGSSVSDPAWARARDYGNARKRKAPPTGSAGGKEACLSKVAEAKGPDGKRCRVVGASDSPVKPKEEEAAAAAASDALVEVKAQIKN